MAVELGLVYRARCAPPGANEHRKRSATSAVPDGGQRFSEKEAFAFLRVDDDHIYGVRAAPLEVDPSEPLDCVNTPPPPLLPLRKKKPLRKGIPFFAKSVHTINGCHGGG